MKHYTFKNFLRWTARITGILMVIFTLFIGIGELLESRSGLNEYNTIVFVIWGGGLAGLILALWREGLGGIISLLCFIIFNILAATNPTPGSGYTYVLLFFMFPSILYIIYWWLNKNSSNKVLDNK